MATGDRRRLMRTLGIPDEGQIGLSPEPATTSTASTGTAGTDLLAVLTGAGSLASVIGQQVDAGNRKIEADLAEIKRQETVNTRELADLEQASALQYLNTTGPRLESDIKTGNISGTPEEIINSLIPDGSSDTFRTTFAERATPLVSRSLESRRLALRAEAMDVAEESILGSIGFETTPEDAQRATDSLASALQIAPALARSRVSKQYVELAAKTGDPKLWEQAIGFAGNDYLTATYGATYAASRGRRLSAQVDAMRADIDPLIESSVDPAEDSAIRKRIEQYGEQIGKENVQSALDRLDKHTEQRSRDNEKRFDEMNRQVDAEMLKLQSNAMVNDMVQASFSGRLNTAEERTWFDGDGNEVSISSKDFIRQVEKQAMQEIAETSESPQEALNRSIAWYASNGVENQKWSFDISQTKEHAFLFGQGNNAELNAQQLEIAERGYAAWKTLQNTNPTVASKHTPAKDEQFLHSIDAIMSVSGGSMPFREAATKAVSAERNAARFGRVAAPSFSDVYDKLESSKLIRKFEKLDNQSLMVQQVQEAARIHMQLGLGSEDDAVKAAIQQLSAGHRVIDGQWQSIRDPNLPQDMDLAVEEAKRLATEQGATGELRLTQYGESGRWEIVDAETGAGTGFSYTSTQLRQIVDAAIAAGREDAKMRALRKRQGVKDAQLRNFKELQDSHRERQQKQGRRRVEGGVL